MATRKKRSGWEEMRGKMASNLATSKSLEDREQVPNNACGRCKKFSENAYASDGRGFCGTLKTGSIIEGKPFYVLEGDAGLITFFNSNGEKCKYFEVMVLVDTDGFECADPQFRRAQRQMANKLD